MYPKPSLASKRFVLSLQVAGHGVHPRLDPEESRPDLSECNGSMCLTHVARCKVTAPLPWQDASVSSGAAKPEDRCVVHESGRSFVQGALAWILAKSPRAIPIPGFRTVEHVEDTVGTLARGPLSPEQMAAIDELLERS